MTLVDRMPSFDTGISEVDEQHKQLVEMLNQLFEAYAEMRGSDVLNELVSDMRNYTETHFTTEEGYMKDSNYPQLAKHREQHRLLTAQVLELERDMAAGMRVLTRDVLDFLNSWLTDHILKEDKAFGEYYQSQCASR